MRFSDVVRELGLTQATTHAILTTLCDRGWASRDPVDKTFSLGPALAVVAVRVETSRPLAHSARTAAMQLADEFGYATSVVERSGDSLVITAFEDSGQRSSGAPGERIRYAPPFGVAFAAWDTDEGQRAWIARGAASNDVLALRLSEVLSRTRERGFDVDCTTPALTQAAHVMGTLPSDGLPGRVREITDQLLMEFTTIGFLPMTAGASGTAGGHYCRAGLRPPRSGGNDRRRPPVAGPNAQADRCCRAASSAGRRRDQRR